MPTGNAMPEANRGLRKRRRRRGRLAQAWRSLGKPLAQSIATSGAVAGLSTGLLRFVTRTNRIAPGSDDINRILDAQGAVILACWHGQTLLAPVVVRPRTPKVMALMSKSADAQGNAMITERLGHGLVRGSGGRDRSKTVEKGGIRALLAMKKALIDGHTVFMTADVPNVPRDAGAGIVALARISGRPILPFAYATSRRKVFAKSWDKYMINLPFGRIGAAAGEPIFVPADADGATLDAIRLLVTTALNAATVRAYALVDGPK